MAPKKKNANANAALKVVCLRHPENAENPCAMNQIVNLKNCNSTSDNTSHLWPGFKDDPKDTGLDKLGDAAACDKLLLQVFTSNQTAYSISAGLPKEDIINSMVGTKGKATFDQVPITKQMLEHAFQVLNLQKLDKQNAKASAKQARANAGPAASSSTETDAQAASAVSTLQISHSASAPATGSSGGNPGGPPPKTPPPPENEFSKSAKEQGVKRPISKKEQFDGKVRTNYFRVDLKKEKDGSAHILHEYQITGLLWNRPNDLSRSKKKVMIKRFLEQSNLTNASCVSNAEGRVIAWKNLDPAIPLGGLVQQHDVPDFDRDQHGVVSQNLRLSLYYVRAIDLSALERYAQGNDPSYAASVAEEALNILMGQAVVDSKTGAIQIGDNHFFLPKTADSLNGWGMVTLRGYTSHVKARQGRLYLNVNTALSAFHEQKLVSEHIEDLTQPRKVFDSRAQQHLIGVRVRIMYNRDKPGEQNSTKDTEAGRLKSITSFSTEFADEIFFRDRHGAKVSVWQHFQKDHPVEAARSKAKGKQICANTSSTTPGRECWFLSDQLEVTVNQIYRKTLDRLDPTMTARMVEIACRRPEKNRHYIETEGLQALGLRTGQANPVRLAEAGIAVTRQMATVPFRRIPPPSVVYQENPSKQYEPEYLSESKWNTRSMVFLSDARDQAFQGTEGVVFFCPPNGLAYPGHGGGYIGGFRKAWQMNYRAQKNIRLGNVFKLFRSMNDPESMTSELKKANAGLFVLALPSANAQVRPLYANFRIATDQILGKPSLVLCEQRILGSFKPGKPGELGNLVPYMANNAMKINVRLGAENHSTDGFGDLSPGNVCDTLVLGADLIHPKGTSSDVCPSIACLAGSVSGNFAKFLGSARRQDSRTEIIPSTNMISMARERIEDWQSANSKRLPARILYYRDGTGISQYGGVLKEVEAIETAWSLVAGSTSATVALSAVVAVKRHTTRFYPGKEESTDTGNCLPGTVVSTDITSPYHFDFYLQSHDVERGSAKPTHYFVLSNDMNISEGAMYQLTNAFCFNFSHSTSAVSYASPAFYADRLCERTMLYLREFFDNDPRIQGLANDTLRTTELDIAWNRGGQGANRNPWHKNFNDKMFWM